MIYARIITGDCVASMQALPANSVDSIVCDPPYGLEFMGKEWDKLDVPSDADGFRRAVNAADAGRDNVFGRASRSSPEYKASAAMQVWHEAWLREALRVLKPGGHIVAFSGTRTSHRLVCAAEDAGFEIRDSLVWMYGSGFPKSLNVGKAVDRRLGLERKVVGYKRGVRGADGTGHEKAMPGKAVGVKQVDCDVPVIAPATPEAAQWEGWGTALKPAHEPIMLARKPLAGTVAANVLKWGTGALNIDGCRVKLAAGEEVHAPQSSPANRGGVVGSDLGFSENDADAFQQAQRESIERTNTLGRWPPNIILSHSPDCRCVGTQTIKGDLRGPDETDGEQEGGFGDVGAAKGDGKPNAAVYGNEEVPVYECAPDCPVALLDAQSGGAARFFPQLNFDPEYDLPAYYAAKAGRKEREEGLEHLREVDAETTVQRKVDSKGSKNPRAGSGNIAGGEIERCSACGKAAGASARRGIEAKPCEGNKDGICTPEVVGVREGRKNSHPTVKPVAVMRWLIRLVTPPGGLVLDPFMGSGTTGVAAALEGVSFCGMEREAEYAEISFGRIRHHSGQPPSIE